MLNLMSTYACIPCNIVSCVMTCLVQCTWSHVVPWVIKSPGHVVSVMCGCPLCKVSYCAMCNVVPCVMMCLVRCALCNVVQCCVMQNNVVQCILLLFVLYRALPRVFLVVMFHVMPCIMSYSCCVIYVLLYTV